MSPDAQLLTGLVKWFTDEKGFGFITPSVGTRDLFVHHTGINGDGYRSLAEGDGVVYVEEQGDKGPKAVSVTDIRTATPTNMVLYVDDQGAIRVAPTIPGPADQVAIRGEDLASLLTRSLLRPALSPFHRIEAEFERLLNINDLREHDLQEFFQQYPDFLLGNEYEELCPQVILPDGSEGDMRPDFILKPLAGVSYDAQIVELKLPSQRLIKPTPRRHSFYAGVYEAVMQLREYQSYFEDSGKRDLVAEKLGFTPIRPRLALVVGRNSSLPDPRVHAQATASISPVDLVTYDDLLLRYRSLHRRQSH